MANSQLLTLFNADISMEIQTCSENVDYFLKFLLIPETVLLYEEQKTKLVEIL